MRIVSSFFRSPRTSSSITTLESALALIKTHISCSWFEVLIIFKKNGKEKKIVKRQRSQHNLRWPCLISQVFHKLHLFFFSFSNTKLEVHVYIIHHRTTLELLLHFLNKISKYIDGLSMKWRPCLMVTRSVELLLRLKSFFWKYLKNNFSFSHKIN